MAQSTSFKSGVKMCECKGCTFPAKLKERFCSKHRFAYVGKMMKDGYFTKDDISAQNRAIDGRLNNTPPKS